MNLIKKSIVTLIALMLLVFSANSSDKFEVFFDFDKHNLNEIQFNSFKNQIQDLNISTIKSIELLGFCDDLGTNEYNNGLSRRRARAIRKQLVQLGFSQKMIKKVIGLGEVQIKTDLPAEEQRSYNRRVEIVINSISVTQPSTKPIQSIEVSEEDTDVSTEIREDIIDNVLNIELPTKANPSPVQEEEKLDSVVNPEAISTPKNEDQLLDILTVMNIGEKITLEEILFKPGTNILLTASDKELKRLANTLNNNNNIKIKILGHVCCAKFGMDGVNSATGKRNLSEVRAKAVYLKLRALNVNSKQMTFEGRKSKEPLGGDDDKDRRVEILIEGM